MTITSPSYAPRPGVSVCSSSQASSVREDFLDSLRNHGLRSPIRGLNDPRLNYPEMLLMNGWERVETDDGYGYRIMVDESTLKGEWSQQYCFHNDGSTTLESTAGRCTQIIETSCDGVVRTRISAQ